VEKLHEFEQTLDPPHTHTHTHTYTHIPIKAIKEFMPTHTCTCTVIAPPHTHPYTHILTPTHTHIHTQR